MGDWNAGMKMATDFGVLGVMVLFGVLIFRLLDKWAARFLEAHVGQTAAITAQATAMGMLSEVVKTGQQVQADILVAVGVMADRLERQRTYLEEIDRNCRERRGGTCT